MVLALQMLTPGLSASARRAVVAPQSCSTDPNCYCNITSVGFPSSHSEACYDDTDWDEMEIDKGCCTISGCQTRYDQKLCTGVT
jgi:hypothetical protein